MRNNLLLQYNSEIAKGDSYFHDSKFQEAESCFPAALYSFSRYICGYCDPKDCNYMKAGFSFVGNKSKQYMDLIFEIESGLIADLYECTEFKCSEISFDGRFKITVDKNNLPF
jgi:hypothetical protein